MLPSVALNEQLCLPRLARVEGLFSHLHFHSPQGEMALGGWLGGPAMLCISLVVGTLRAVVVKAQSKAQHQHHGACRK